MPALATLVDVCLASLCSTVGGVLIKKKKKNRVCFSVGNFERFAPKHIQIIDFLLFSGCTMSQGKDNARLKSYKNKSLNTDEMRRRREEEGLQLRKQKKDEQVSKVLYCTTKTVIMILKLHTDSVWSKLEAMLCL